MNDYSLDMRSLAIGDIHGCNTALVTLLAHVQPQPNDRIVFLGDYIDRGPASRVVVETLIILEKTCSPVFLRGNHEIMMLEARHDTLKDNPWQSYGGSNDVGFAVCIDTGAIYGGWLTCLDVESGKYWQANELGQAREGSINLA